MAWSSVPPSAEPGSLRRLVLTSAAYAALFLPGAVVGGILGWLIIRPVNWLLGQFFRAFNYLFELATRAYGRTVGWSLRLSVIVLLLYGGLIGLTYYGFTKVPGGFVPNQDRGYLVANIQLPDSASLERTIEVTAAVEKIASEPSIKGAVITSGKSNGFCAGAALDEMEGQASGGGAAKSDVDRTRL